MIRRVVHPKVRWAAVASIVAAACTALAGSLGASEPAWVASMLTGVAAALAGFQAPAKDVQDDGAING